jgi:hypothetical protein
MLQGRVGVRGFHWAKGYLGKVPGHLGRVGWEQGSMQLALGMGEKEG